MTEPHFATHGLLLLLHLTATLLISVRVVMRRPAPGTALAWLFLVAALPLGGALLYLLIGERRVGLRRARRLAALRTEQGSAAAALRSAICPLPQEHPNPTAARLDRLGQSSLGAPLLHGCGLELFPGAEAVFPALIQDIDQTRQSLLMEFYIWHAGGQADAVLEAVLRATQRGVRCRILVDALGGHAWWQTDQPERLRRAGVELLPALPVGFIRFLFARNDLRLHRKIVILDGRIAWTGSMNLVDPRFFKQQAHVGQWKDAMVRVQGPAVLPLAATLLTDWATESNSPLRPLLETLPIAACEAVGPAAVQVAASGPGITRGGAQDGILQLLLTLINGAREELVLTTPYFVPDETLLRALRGAAGRGVRVRLVLPARVDSLMTRFVSRSYYDELLEVGVEILLYGGGLLHTKSVVADRELALFGTLNLDMRSIWLNYEVSLFICDQDFCAGLRDLQEEYIGGSTPLDPGTWAARPLLQRFVENALRLAGPLL